MIGGLALIGVGAYLNVAELGKLEGYFSPSVVLFYGFAGGVALAAITSPMLVRNKQGALATLLCVGVLCGEAFAFYSTAERLLAAREDRAARIGDTNAPRKLAEDARTRALADLAMAKAEADKARSDKKCGAVCAAWEDRETQARFHLNEADKQIKATSSIREAKPLAHKLGISEDVADLIPALLGSAALLIMGFGLIAAGSPGPHAKEPEPKPDDVEALPVTPGRLLRKDEAIARIRQMTRDNGGRPPAFSVVRNELQLPKATTHRYRKEAMGG